MVISRLTQDKKCLRARLMAFLAGDGGVYFRKRKNQRGSSSYELLFCPDHKSLLDLFVQATKVLYQKTPNVHDYGRYYKARVFSKEAYTDLMRDSQYGKLTWRVPREFLKTKKMKKEWLRAFWDCEGYVGRRQLQVQSVNEIGLIQVRKLLREFNVESNLYNYKRANPNWNINHILSISSRPAIWQFFKNVGFNHEVKAAKLSLMFNASVPESGKWARLEQQ